MRVFGKACVIELLDHFTPYESALHFLRETDCANRVIGSFRNGGHEPVDFLSARGDVTTVRHEAQDGFKLVDMLGHGGSRYIHVCVPLLVFCRIQVVGETFCCSILCCSILLNCWPAPWPSNSAAIRTYVLAVPS